MVQRRARPIHRGGIRTIKVTLLDRAIWEKVEHMTETEEELYLKYIIEKRFDRLKGIKIG